MSDLKKNCISDHWLTSAVHNPSPNQDQRPDDTDISLIVVHCISLPAGHFGGPYIEQLFGNCLRCTAHADFADLSDLHVSAHLLIRRTGEIVQFAGFDRRAWHAGISTFEQRDNCNDYSIGIELEGTDDSAFNMIQYNSLAEVCIALMRDYPAITRSRIVGHSDVAAGRKSDPGPLFDWSRLFELRVES